MAFEWGGIPGGTSGLIWEKDESSDQQRTQQTKMNQLIVIAFWLILSRRSIDFVKLKIVL